MNYTLPHSIQNSEGEKLIFKQLIKEPDGDKLIVENFVDPSFGPPMHTHFLQDEVLTVLKGKIGYQVKGMEPQYAGPGETVAFKAGIAHRFWNAGYEVLHCEGYIKPANSIVFFLSALFAAQVKTGSARPEMFDASYLLYKYRSEFSLEEIPPVVRKVVMPATYFVGNLLGKYKHFKDAPAPQKVIS